MVNLNEFNSALRIRDVIRSIVASELDRLRPKYRYATVNSINRSNYTATVVFAGDPPTAIVTVKMGSIQPSANGQVVRIEGLPGDRFIADVMGTAY